VGSIPTSLLQHICRPVPVKGAADAADYCRKDRGHRSSSVVEIRSRKNRRPAIIQAARPESLQGIRVDDHEALDELEVLNV